MARNNPVLVGSSATVRLSDRKLAARTVKSKSTRTGELWAAYDDSAEIQHSVRYRGDLIERVQFYVAVTASGQRQAAPVPQYTVKFGENGNYIVLGKEFQ